MSVEPTSLSLPDWVLKCDYKRAKVEIAGDKQVTQLLDPDTVAVFGSLLASYFLNKPGGSSSSDLDRAGGRYQSSTTTRHGQQRPRNQAAGRDSSSMVAQQHQAERNLSSVRCFLGSLAQSLMRSDLQTITDPAEQYHLLLKSDGTRYLMFAFEHQTSKEDQTKKQLLAIVDRSFSWKIVKGIFAKDVYRGTVFDGELVQLSTDGSWVYQIFDVIAYCGTSVVNDPHSLRLSSARKCISSPNMYKYDPNVNTFAIVVKEYISELHALRVLQSLGSTSATQPMSSSAGNNNNSSAAPPLSDCPVDGIILVSEIRPYVSCQDKLLFKYKRPEDNTLDFKVALDTKGQPSLCVIDSEKSLLRVVQSPAGLDRECLQRLRVANESMLLDKILECKWEGNRWVPVMCRFDKSAPNNLDTMEKTVLNRQENITPEELYRLLKSRSNQKQ